MVSHVTGLRILVCMFLGIKFPLRVGRLIMDFAVPLLVPLIEFTVIVSLANSKIFDVILTVHRL